MVRFSFGGIGNKLSKVLVSLLVVTFGSVAAVEGAEVAILECASEGPG